VRHSITGFSNPTVKRLRSLREKKHRKREGKFLAEGLRIIVEAFEAGIVPEILVFAKDQELHPLAVKVEQAVEENRGTVIETDTAILAKISGKDNPQSIVAVYADQFTPLDQIDRSANPIWFVVQAMRDPGNLGTMLRTADAVGAGGIILVDDCVDPFSIETVRASMGAIFTQKVAQSSWLDFLNWFRSGSGQLVGTSLNSETDYQALSYSAPTFLLIGNEARGLPPEYEAECSHLVKIPMLGKADSLNAAMAAAVMAYEVVNQRRR